MWFNLAASRLPPGKDGGFAAKYRDIIAERMTPSQVAEPNAPVPAQALSSYQNKMCHNPLEISYNGVFKKGFGPCR